MKHLVRSFVFHVVALWFATQLLPALVVLGTWQNLLFAGLILTVLMFVLQPFLKILFIPLNFITFGLLSWMVNVIIIYVLTLLMPEVQIMEWTFPGFEWSGFIIPSIHLNYYMSLVASTLLISFITNSLHTLSEG